MTELIQDLWILSKDGLILFENVKEEKVHADLFGAMISALNTCAETLEEGGISTFEIGDNNQFVVIKEDKYLFVTRTLKEFDNSRVKSALKTIAHEFFALFSDVLPENWTGGNIDSFLRFKEKLKKKFSDGLGNNL